MEEEIEYPVTEATFTKSDGSILQDQCVCTGRK